MTAKAQPNDRQLTAKLRAMRIRGAADSCDPEFNRALIEAADEIERLRAAQDAAIRILSDDRLPLPSRINDARAVLARSGNQQQAPVCALCGKPITQECP